MICCSKLFRDINFVHDAIQPCCNNRDLPSIPRFSFNGGKVNMIEYGRFIKETLNLLQDGNICNGCPELIKIDTEGKMSKLNILFHTVSLNMHEYLCNCKCIYCDFHKQTLPSYSILPSIESLYSQGALHKNCFFSWGGGESTILREFEEAATFIYDKGFKQNIHTNALHYSDAIAALLSKDAGSINISLDCGSPEIYKIVKGVDGFERVIANIGKYVSASVNKYDVTIKYIIFAANNSQQEIEKFFAIMKHIGIKNLQFSFNFREVNANNISNETLYAAILFVGLANALKIQCSPFFVDNKIINMMETLVSQIASHGMDKSGGGDSDALAD
jgi:sulfatase maturation enzyme AslB (radical SAM superfamily)